jgi:tetratricopeptide (TPR) repeat protein
LPAQTQTAASASQQTPPQFREVTVEQRADIYMARKSYADAIDYYHRALRQQGPSANLWNKLGIACQLEMNYRAARKAYKEAAKRRTDFAEPWNNLGTTYFLESKFRKSVKYYRQALKRTPGSASFHMNLGASYSHMKKFPQAVEQYREALSLDPNVLTEHSPTATVVQAQGADVEFYFYLAKVFASLARPEDSVHYLRRALEDGFKDLKRLDEDPDFRKISHYPAYVELRKNLPVAISD